MQSHTSPDLDLFMRRLLIVTHAFPPNPAPGSARAWRFYKYLQEFGYETHVITASPQDEPQPRVTWVPVPARNLGERIVRKFIFPCDEDIQWTVPAIRAAEKLIAATPMDAVLSTVPYIQDHLIAYRLKKEFGLPWIADYRDPVAGNPFRRATGIPGMADRLLDSQFFATADLLVAVTDYGRQAWIGRSPEVESKSAVIWNGFDPEEPILPMPIPTQPYRLISHFGSFYGGRNPVIPLESALRLVRHRSLDPSRFRFRLVGALEPEIRAHHNELFQELTTLGCLELEPVVPRTQALHDMMESDSLLLADNNQAAIGHTVPAKLFEYIRVGRPILALTVQDSPVERILAMSGVRFVTLFPEMDEPTIDARVMRFLNLSTDPCDLSEQFLVDFNGRNQARTLAGLIDKLLGVRPCGGPIFDEKLMDQAEAV
jgi:glycosyltransferase involved in cell wall biosynthesis